LKLGWLSVDAMLDNLSMSEYVDWIAYFGVDWAKWKPDQSPETIAANLALSLAGKNKKGK
jgi:hypothetical protein